MENILDKSFLLRIIEELRLLYSKFNSQEPIPVYTEKEIDELFNCIQRIYQGYLPTVEERIATALFNITKNHYLSNGNKRMAIIVACTLSLLETPTTTPLKVTILSDLVLKIADGTIANKEATIKEFNKLL